MEDVVEIDLKQIWDVIKKYWLQFVLVVAIVAVAAMIFTSYFIAKTYTAEAKIVIVQKNENAVNQGITYNDLQLSQKLVSTYSQIMKSEAISDVVIANLDLFVDHKINTASYNSMVSISNENNTEVMKIKVTSKDPKLSADIANEIVDVFQFKIFDIMQIENVTILNQAKIPTSPSGPSLMMNTAIAAVLALMLCGAFVVYKLMTDTKVKTEAELKAIFDYPIIGIIQEYSSNDREVLR